MQRSYLLFLGLMLLGLLPRQIIAASFTLQSLMDRRSELFDDPRSFRQELEVFLTSLDRQSNPELWVMLHAFAGEGAWFQEDIEGIRVHVAAALPFAQDNRHFKGAALLTYLKAGILEYEGKFEEADPVFRKAIALAKESGDLSMIAYVSAVAASFYHRNNHSNESTELYSEALQLFRKLPQDYIYNDYLAGIGTLYAQTIGPKRELGFKMLEDSINYAREHKLRYQMYWTNQSINTLNKELERFDNADKIINENLAIAESLGYETYIVGTRLDRGRILFRQKRYQEALVDFEFARNYYKNRGISFYQIQILSDLGICYIRLNQLDKVKPLIADFDGALKESSSTSQKQEVYVMQQNYYRATGEKDKELPILRELLDLIDKNAEAKKAEELGRLAKDMELQRQQSENDQLSFANKLQTEEIQRRERTQKLMLMGLGLGFLALVASAIALHRGRLIKKQRASLKLILDTIEEGILRFDAQLRVKDEYSRFSSELLAPNQDLHSQNLWPLLFERAEASREDQQIWRESLRAIMGEGALAWDLNEAHLPRQLKREQRILELDWQPLPDAEGLTQMILLRIRDITQSVEVQKEARVAQDRVSKISDRLDAIARGRPHRISQFLLEAEKVILPLHKTIRFEEDYSDIKRMLHTMKGAARSLGLKDLSEAVHGFEDLLITKNFDLAAFTSQILELENILAAYRDLLPHLNLMQGDQPMDTLWDVAAKLLPEAQQRLTLAFGESPSIVLQDSFTDWQKLDTKVIHDILLHAITNSIDHGFILPLSRGQKLSKAVLKIEAQWQQNQLELLVRDNGAGIDWQRLELLAKEKNFQASPGRELTDVLFLDGITTAESLTTTSGRGMGLSAIQSFVRKMGGDVSLTNNNEGPGTVLRFHLPVEPLLSNAGSF